MKSYRHKPQSFGHRRVTHIRAAPGEWVRVHRTPPVSQPTSAFADRLRPLLLKVGGGILLFVIICKILTALLPFLVLGAIGWLFIVARK
jgi:hypothetical protein